MLVLLLLALPVATAAARPALDDDPVLNIAHRGASGLAPEHTFAAYDLALKQGADFIEQDLQQTSDGTLVVLHDETLDRAARGPVENCTGLVATKTLEQIRTCDVGSWFNERYPDRARGEYVGLRIPTLEEVLRRYRHRTNLYIETKDPDQANAMEERLVALLDEYHLLRPAQRRWQVLVQSFSPASLLRVRDLEPGLPLVQLFSSRETSGSIQARLDGVEDYAVGIGPSKTDVDAALVQAAHARCLDVHPYTLLDDPDEIRGLIDLGVDGMFANFPAVLEEVLGKDAAGGKQAAKRAAETHADCVAGS
ncbi:MAG TPA: glycerophosphodiester phosphodiesterase [Solirubrobacteraceae bacterium]|nr:glycerophosphodiester phosphodiesterase [Solirubrobacteraceae bacterium]